MKQSTIEILDNAMSFNTEVQEDQLNLQEQCDALCSTASKLQDFIKLGHEVKEIEGNPNAASFCDACFEELKESNPDNPIIGNMSEFSSLEELERPTYFYHQIDSYNKATLNYISHTLLNMLECSIADLDSKIKYVDIKKLNDVKAVMYNYHAVDNITTTLSEILNSICKTGCENLTYKQLRKKFTDMNDINLAVLNTYISSHDYTAIKLPCPKNQTIKEAELTADRVNEMSKMVNTIVSDENLKDLTSIKYSISKRLSNEDKIDAIKAIHFISQIVMAVKNSVITLQNYHKAFINELM